MQQPRVEPHVGTSRSWRDAISDTAPASGSTNGDGEDLRVPSSGPDFSDDGDDYTMELADAAEQTVDVPIDDGTGDDGTGDDATGGDATERPDSAARPAATKPAATKPDAPKPDAQVGSLLSGRYVLHRLIGTGGTCRVFLAEDLHRRLSSAASGELIALKVLRPGMRHPEHALQRLRREFLQMQQLTHPAITRVFDLGCDGDLWFMTMELVDAPSALTWMATEYSNADALRLILTCCEAVDHAHRKGIVHGDLKPGNVLVQRPDSAKLIDFGSVVGRDEDPMLEAKHEATPQYASPAVLAGNMAGVSDDVFALGCLAYMILARGRHPFDRKPATEAAHAQLRAPYIPGIPLRLFEVVARALAWDPALRQASVRELQHALLAAGQSHPNRSSDASAAPSSAHNPSIPATDAAPSAAHTTAATDEQPTPEMTSAASAVSTASGVTRPRAKVQGDYSYLSKFRGYVAGPMMDVKPHQLVDSTPSPTHTEPCSEPHTEPYSERQSSPPTPHIGDVSAPVAAVESPQLYLAATALPKPKVRALQLPSPRKRALVNALGLSLVLASAVGAALFSRPQPPSALQVASLPDIELPILTMPTPAMEPFSVPKITIARNKPEKPTQGRSTAAKPAAKSVPPSSPVWFGARAMEVSPNQTLVAIPIRRSTASRGAVRIAWQIEGDRGKQLLDADRAGSQVIQFHEGQAARTLYVCRYARKPVIWLPRAYAAFASRCSR